MATISHEAPVVVRRAWWLDARDLWASLAIATIWLAVLFSAVFGPDIRTIEASGASVKIPSAVVIAFFAMFATAGVAKYGFDRRRG